MPATWTFLTSHASLLVAIAEAPSARVCELAARTGLTERTVYRLLRQLAAEHYISRTSDGHRTHSALLAVNPDRPLRLPGDRVRRVGPLLHFLATYPLDSPSA